MSSPLHDLEQVPLDAPVVNGLRYTDFRKTLAPYYGRAWRDIFSGYAAIIAVLTGCALLPGGTAFVILQLLCAPVLLGFLLAYLSLFLHEAGHFNLHRIKKKNDRLANVLLGCLFGLAISSYRKIHWQHHVHLATGADTETSYYHTLTPKFLLETLTGIHLLRTMRSKAGKDILNERQRKEGLRMLLLGGLLHATLVTVLFFIGGWSLGVIWILAMIIFFPCFATIRQVLEHRDEFAGMNSDFTRQAHGRVTRLFTSNFFANIFGGAGFKQHMLHHWDPQVSYTRLKDVERFLEHAPQTSDLVKRSRTSYTATWQKLFRHG